MHIVTLLTRSGCHLCDEVDTALRRLQPELGFELHVDDVDADADRQDTYGDRVPVILIDGREHGYWRLEEDRFRAALGRG